LRYHGHACILLGFQRLSEATSPVQSIEKSDDNIAAYSFLDTLQTSTTAQELFESQTFVVVDDLVMGQNHQKRVELDTAIRIGRDQHFLIEDVHSLSAPLYFMDRNFG
jgi:CRISPR/Cas system CMR subunit Cmr4 (Cas7 group RAMP superfamily)